MRLSLAAITTLMSLFVVSGSRHVCVGAMGRSAHAFAQYFQALQQEPLNPVERVVFSLALTQAKARQECRTARHG
ncbi:MAG: hypothetical protein ABSH50_12070 [Bryobacteraceae bacterium]